MTNEEVGVYIKLLCYEWDSGFLPKDKERIRRIANCRASVLDNVLDKFVLTENGYINQRLERTRKEQLEYREKNSMRGKNGAAARWANKNEVDNAKAMLEHNKSNAKALQNTMLNGGSSSSSASSVNTIAHTPIEFLKHINIIEFDNLKKQSGLPDEEWELCCAKWENAILGDTKWDWTGDQNKDYRVLYNRLDGYQKSWVKFKNEVKKRSVGGNQTPISKTEHAQTSFEEAKKLLLDED